MPFIALKLKESSRELIKEKLNIFPDENQREYLHHVTLLYSKQLKKDELEKFKGTYHIEVVGIMKQPTLVSLVVKVNKNLINPLNGNFYHVTWLTTPGKTNPADSSMFIRDYGYQEIIPFDIEGDLGYFY